MKVINIRGTNGSGKTSLVRALIAEGETPATEIEIGTAHTPGLFLPDRRIVVVGPYKEGKATGGCDNVRTTQELVLAVQSAVQGDFTPKRVIAYDDPPNAVVFEGILPSTVYGTWATCAQELRRQGHTFVFAYMLTSVEDCINRVRARRAAKGRPEEGFKTELVQDKFRTVAATRAKARTVGHAVLDLPPGGELAALLSCIKDQ